MSAVPIIFVIGSLDVGGAERHLVQVIPRLSKERWKPVVYCLIARGELAFELERRGIPVICSPVAGPLRQTSKIRRAVQLAGVMLSLARFMRNTRPAIAHFFLPYSYVVGAPAALLARVPARIMSRRSLNEYQKGNPLSAWLEPLLHQTMTAIVGNSRRVVQQLHEEESVPLSRLGLIYNGVEADGFLNTDRRTAERAELNISADALTFVIVANLIPYKGHADVLAAFGLANPSLPVGWRLLIAGRDDGIEQELRLQAASLGIGKNILFLGPGRDIQNLLQAADIALLSSHQEGFSNAILEYMAAGLPTIATDVGGNAEAILNDESGLIVPPHDPVTFAEAIVRLGNDAGLRMRLGQNARRRVKDQFSIEACVSRYEALYSGLLAGKDVKAIGALRF